MPKRQRNVQESVENVQSCLTFYTFCHLTFSLPSRRRIVKSLFFTLCSCAARGWGSGFKSNIHIQIKTFLNSTGVNPCAVKRSHNVFWILKLHLFVILTVIDGYIYIQEITSFSPAFSRLPQSSSVLWCKGQRLYCSSIFPFSRVIRLVSCDFSRSWERGSVISMTEVM